MQITLNHIRFYDEMKLRAAHAALESSPARAALVDRFERDFPRYLKAKRPAPGAPTVSVHRLIPRGPVPKDAHLLGNLKRMVDGRMKCNGESLRAALLHFACGTGAAGQRAYAKHAQRWLRKLK